MAELTYRDAVAAGIAQEMRRDENVVFLGEDIGAAGGVFKATVGLFEEFGPKRVRDTPISEQAILGAGRAGEEIDGAEGGLGLLRLAVLRQLGRFLELHIGRLGGGTALIFIPAPDPGGRHAQNRDGNDPVLVFFPEFGSFVATDFLVDFVENIAHGTAALDWPSCVAAKLPRSPAAPGKPLIVR